MHTQLKTNHALAKAVAHWKYVSPILVFPKNSQDYDSLVARLGELLDIVGDNENHPLIGLIDILTNLITAYEKTYIKPPKTKNAGVKALKFLMEAHNLRQADLSEIASQGVISEILNGKRALNIRQITLLSKYFNVDPATFIDE